MNRRQFLYAGAAAAALLGRTRGARAAAYDLIIKGGRIIDSSTGFDAVGDVAIVRGVIAAVATDIQGDASETIDAHGRIVAPGLIDIHTHAGRSKEGPPMCLQDGVTCWIDAGSGGADNVDQVAAVARGAPQMGRILVNIARTGVIAPEGELHDINSANVALAQGAIARNRDVVVGVKARLSNNVAGANDLEALRRAQEAAAPFGLPVMIHVGQNYSPLRSILALLKRGDIVTHMYAPGMNGILDDKGVLIPEVMAARRRGVLFDFGNGVADHFDWDTVEKATRQGLWPDTFSTDWNTQSKTSGVVDLPNVMSKFIMYGMPLSQIIACATVNPARIFASFDDRGTLNIGAPADVAIMELREGSFEFLDNYKGVRTGKQRLFPAGTVLAGKRVAHA
ncbi:MAG: amidohydrolase/deacetylase family metallohydrolase [Bradyrhizobium sp.]|uniref:amidohydrolase/deacetylase family metallohydrolase n=1 Tax=Bradyrhizobium sp. TaxID=376 RepID=UPI001DBACA65|nr:amidohydrolase/deacetylase family metallohydrolase [Bradyrhizobium sp.]MBV9565150.1 amidohydrolase/deacetylase family metallohydrolase [Bradyrhizobium sp.]